MKDLFHRVINYWIETSIITDELIKKEEEKRQKYINENFGIFSVSETYRNNHLWEIFGDNHKGFCVGIDSNSLMKLDEGGVRGKVDYVVESDLPKSRVLNHDSSDFIFFVFDLILKLPIKYLEEQEYRLKKTISNHSERFKHLNKKDIKRIILGYRMSSSQKRMAVDLIKNNLPETEIIQLKYSKGSYKEVFIN